MSNFNPEKKQECDLLVAFTDMTGFARMCKNLSPEEIFNFLEEYYLINGETIEKAGGKIVKFMGDASLIIFEADRVNEGVIALLNLKKETERWLESKSGKNKLIIKTHIGPVMCGPIGTENHKAFDVFGLTVNTAAMLQSHGFAMTPQVFRKLSSKTRKKFKKHTQAISYIPVEEFHKDR